MQSWHGFVSDQQVKMLVETEGTTADDEQVIHPAGTLARIVALANFGEFQGEGVDVIVGKGAHAICNSFDDRDVEAFGGFPFIPL
jgi:hypothetical protein